MATFVTPDGERVEAFRATADLFRRRGWAEITEPEMPKRNASRDEWAAHAQALGYEVEDMTRASIIAAFDSLDS